MLRPLRGLDEIHVLQQVRHAGLAVAFVARAHQVGDVDGDLGLGGSGNSSTCRPLGKAYSVMPPMEAFFWTPSGRVSARTVTPGRKRNKPPTISIALTTPHDTGV